jgi:hypothetical protein
MIIPVSNVPPLRGLMCQLMRFTHGSRRGLQIFRRGCQVMRHQTDRIAGFENVLRYYPLA